MLLLLLVGAQEIGGQDGQLPYQVLNDGDPYLFMYSNFRKIGPISMGHTVVCITILAH